MEIENKEDLKKIKKKIVFWFWAYIIILFIGVINFYYNPNILNILSQIDKDEFINMFDVMSIICGFIGIVGNIYMFCLLLSFVMFLVNLSKWFIEREN